MRLSVVVLIVALLGNAVRAKGFRVFIDYSFPLPSVLGGATPSSENCCPFIPLPENNTDSKIVPTVFGLGAQKAGTTTFHSRLIDHPDIVNGGAKELHALDSDGNISLPKYLLRWAWNQLPENASADARIEPPPKGHLYEFTPSYFFTPIAACRLKIISPNAKLIVLFRDPAERAHSGVVHTKNKQLNNFPNPPNWVLQDFWNMTYEAILDIQRNPQCDFHSGKGQLSYHDCGGCIAGASGSRSRCEHVRFATVVENDDFECGFVGTWQLLRGMYASQLATWFTFFHPSQFMLINSVDFFADQPAVMQEVCEFLGLDPYTTETLSRSRNRRFNVGSYPEEKEEMLSATLSALKEYYRRPNLEFYRLLREIGHEGFVPFEEELRDLDTLDCHDSATVETGICGRDLDAWLDSDWRKLRISNNAERNATASFLKQAREARHSAPDALHPAPKCTPNADSRNQDAEDSALEQPATPFRFDPGHVAGRDWQSGAPIPVHFLSGVLFTLCFVCGILFLIRGIRRQPLL